MSRPTPRPHGAAADRRSLHERIAADLRDEIMCGDLAPGAKVPSTAQLKARFDASNATVQKALQLLKDEQLAVGRAGAAVTVREHRQRTIRPAASLTPANPGRPYPWLTELAKHGTADRLSNHHRDPFDRLLIAQAQIEGMTLVTRDKWIPAYDVPVMSV